MMLKQLGKEGDKRALEIIRQKKEDKRKRKRDKKARAKIGDDGQVSSMNYNVGDNRFAANFKCDW
jgi:hypothetical protein